MGVSWIRNENERTRVYPSEQLRDDGSVTLVGVRWWWGGVHAGTCLSVSCVERKFSAFFTFFDWKCNWKIVHPLEIVNNRELKNTIA